MASKADSKETDFISAERDAKYKAWMQSKSLRDKALEYLAKLDKRRSGEEESCREVAMAMCAIQRLMGADGSGSSSGGEGNEENELDNSAAPKDDISSKTAKMAEDLRTAWMKWTMENFAFKDIKLSAADLAPLTAGAKEEGYNPVDDGSGAMVADSLKYFYPQRPDKPGDKVKPLTSDQKHKNTLYMRELKKLWKACKEKLATEVKEVAEGRAVIKSGKKPTSTAEAKGTDRADGEKKSKGESGGGGSGASEATPSEQGAASAAGLTGARLELKILNDLSLKRLREWVEEDEDAALAEEARKSREKRDENKKLHEMFVAKMERLDEQKRRDAKRLAAEERERKQEEEERASAQTKEAFEKWAIQKEIRESSLRCLVLLPYPQLPASMSDKTVVTASTARQSIVSTSVGARTSEGAAATLQNLYAMQDSEDGAQVIAQAIEVGRALKKVDRTLLPDWARWCDKVVPFNTAAVFWDAFEPMCCDVHSAVTSSVKDAFLKVLRPGMDYQAVFTEYATRQLRRRGGGDLESMDKEEKDKAFAEVSVPKKQMEGLLQELGLSLKPAELRTLIDAFDANGDGKITVGEFKDFCAAGRAGLAGSSRCCWWTTCSCTGMPNAFSVSEPTKKQLREGLPGESQAEAKDYSGSRSDAGGSKQGGAADAGADFSDLRKTITHNGEKRIIIELKDRARREKLCRTFGVIAADSTAPGSPDGYGDEDFDDYDGGDADSKASGGRKGGAKVAKVYKNADRGQGTPCSFSLWTNEDRRKGLEVLYDVSRVHRHEEVIRNMLTQGQPPKAPRMWVDLRTAGPGSSFELDLCWEPTKGDLVSFFCLEYLGPVGSTARDASYREVYRDPGTADPNEQFQFGCKFPQDAERFGLRMDKLQPGTSYQFRLRAFNGFGPGDYCYKAFTTRPDAPPAPRIQKLSFDSVTLRWAFSDTFFKRLQDLRKLFDRADVDRTGSVSRDGLLRALEEKDSPSLRVFLDKRASSLGIDLSLGYGALFDQIDADDGGELSWSEFEAFFVGAGWADSKLSLSMAGGASASQSMMRSGVGASGTSLSGGGGAGRPAKQDITFVVEQCENEFDNVYKEVLKTSLGQGTIHRLEPGKSYRFRVYSINIEGVAGPRSDSVVVHTMLETPAAPTLSGIDSRRVTLSWKNRAADKSTRHPAAVQKMVADWAGTHGENDGGVSIETVFAKYDRDGSGDIDARELAVVLEDLGVEVSEERLSEAFGVLDANGDGIITYDEFAAWWRREEVVYVLKRSEPIYIARPDVRASTASLGGGSVAGSRIGGAGAGRASSNARLGAIPEDRSVSGASAVARGLTASGGGGKGTKTTAQIALPVVVYRGEEQRYQVLGLEPNRYYHFKLRYAGSRCNSLLSALTAVMTAPLPPSAPLLIDVTSTTVRVKWYPPAQGAYKFVVQLRAKGSGASGSGSRRAAPAAQDPTPGGSDGWIVVFNGQDTLWTSTTMVPDCDYEVRVLAANCQGTFSEPSPALAFSTLGRDAKPEQQGPRYADAVFTIECTGDICVGDTILITERLFAADRTGSSSSGGGGGGGGSVAEGSQLLPGGGKSVASASRGGRGASSTVRMEMSVTSQSSKDGYLAPGTFIGERTVACNVVKDNYRTSRDALAASGVTPADSKRFGRSRKLWLEVVWQRASSDACKPYELRPGEVVERVQSNLEQFEVFRSPWRGAGEASRLGLVDEWAALTDCYVALDVEPL